MKSSSDEEDLSDTDEKNTKDTDGSTKKKPGRPKKQIIKKVIPKLGIVNEPLNKALTDNRMIHIFELVYDNPIMFKKIFALFKSMSVETIRMRLEKHFIKMYAIDHLETMQIYINIHGSKMNRYYVSKVLEFGLSQNNIQKILQTLNKDCSKIYWYTNVQYERSKINIGLTNDEMDEETVYNLDLDQIDEYNWAGVENEILEENTYPLKFELPFKYFKKKVTDFNLLGDIMKIEKHGDNGLTLSYSFTNKKGSQNTYFRNPSKIHLQSTLNANEIFSTSVYLNHIKLLASSLISDSIHISACIDKKLIFTALLDQDEKSNKEKIVGSEKCEIKILTEIVRA